MALPNNVKEATDGNVAGFLNDLYQGYLDNGTTSKPEVSASLSENALNYLMQTEINERNIEMQRETNQLQIDENEKAYRRSTVQAQIKQFMDAGYSRQQAMQAVLGAAAGSYDPATLTAPQAAAPQLSGFADAVNAGQQNELSAFQSQMQMANTVVGGISQLAQTGIDLVNAFSSPTGGGIGLLAANKTINTLMPYVSNLPAEARCISGLMDYARQEGCPEGLAKFVNSVAFKRVLNFAPSQRALDAFLGDSFKYAQGVEQFSSVRYNNRILAVNAFIKEQTQDYEIRKSQAESIIAQMDSQYQENITPQKILNAQDLLALEFNDINIKKAAYDNPKYRQDKLTSLLSNESVAAVVAQMTQTKMMNAKQLMDKPELSSLVAGLEMFQSCGMSGDLGSVAAIILSNPDLDLSEFHRQALALIQQIMSAGTATLNGANSVAGWFGSLFNQ